MQLRSLRSPRKARLFRSLPDTTAPGSTKGRFRRLVEVGETIVVSTRMDERSGRRLRLSGELSVSDEPGVEASGLYLVSVPVEGLLAGHRDAIPHKV